MLQVGIEPTTLAYRYIRIHFLYKSDALPTVLLEQKFLMGIEPMIFCSEDRRDIHFATGTKVPLLGIEPRTFCFH